MLSHWVWLSQAVIPGAKGCHELLERFGDAKSIYESSKEELRLSDGIKKAELSRLCDKNLDNAEKLIQRCAKDNISIISMADDAYPSMLKNVYSPPPVIFCRGSLPDFEKTPSLTIVGTRKSSAEGERIAYEFSCILAKMGCMIVSGMASGIDTNANRGCLEGGMPTVAVLGCGVDVVYPPENDKLMERIIANGAVISEYPPGCPALPHHFPTRNRIMAALGLGTLVVEAPQKSGALITARLALDMGRDVFVVPGSIYHSGFAGSNNLIKEGSCIPVISAEDITSHLPVHFEQIETEKTEFNLDDFQLKPDERKIAELMLHHRRLHLDQMLNLSGLSEADILTSVMALELKGIIVHEGADFYTVYE